MAKGKKRKPPKNSNYQTGGVQKKRKRSPTSEESGEKRKRHSPTFVLFGVFATVFYVYFVLNLYSGTEDLSANVAQYLIPAVIFTAVAVVLRLKGR